MLMFISLAKFASSLLSELKRPRRTIGANNVVQHLGASDGKITHRTRLHKNVSG